MGVRLVDIGVQYLYLAAAAVVHNLLNLFHVGEILAKVSCLEFCRIMGLEPASLVADPCVAGCVGLVEGVRRKLAPVCPNLVQGILGMAVLYTAFYKLCVKALKNVNLLLTHGLTQLVRLAFGEAGHLLGNTHNLLLVNGNAVGLFQELSHYRKVKGNLFFSALTGNKGGNVVHRARTVQGVHGNQVLEALRMQPLEPFLHARGLKLEHALGVTAGVEGIGCRVVDRNLFYVDINSVMLLHQGQAFLYDGQGPKAQEVHFKHAHFFYVRTLVL